MKMADSRTCPQSSAGALSRISIPIDRAQRGLLLAGCGSDSAGEDLMEERESGYTAAEMAFAVRLSPGSSRPPR
jgi:hypothetical protein